MTREQALPYVSYAVDDALSERRVDEMPPTARLVGWQCGFEPLFVAVWSYVNQPGDEIMFDPAEAEEIAADFLIEKGWFTDGKKAPDDFEAPPADYVL